MADTAERVSGSRFTWEQWIAFVRLVAVVLAALQVGVFADTYPPGYEKWAWLLTAGFAAVGLTLFVLSRYERRPRIVGFAALAVDTLVVAAYGLIFSFEYGSPMRWALIFVVAEAALRYGLRGGIALPVVLLPYLYAAEAWRAEEFGPPDFIARRVLFPLGVLLLTGLIVGWLVSQLRAVAMRAEARAADAERLRDELSRRVDVFEAANRCARALGSSLELDAAFAAFNRELGALVPFDRAVILLEEDGRMRAMAIAGAGAESTGADQGVSGSILEHVAETGRVAYRPDISDKRFLEEENLYELGLRSRVAAPLELGGRPIGALSVSRREVDAFLPEEVELIALLGRLVAAAVQNIRTYDAERATVVELRRLSALRADFVALVSHELRSPMTAVIGAAHTLQQRWRELRPEQREAFLTVIGDETSRLENSDRRRARHLAHRGGHLRLCVLGRDLARRARRRSARPSTGRTKCAWRSTSRLSCRTCAATKLDCASSSTTSSPTPSSTPTPAARSACTRGATTASSTSGSATAVPASRPRTTSSSSRSSAVQRAPRHGLARGSGSSSRGRSPRRTAACSRSTPGPARARPSP